MKVTVSNGIVNIPINQNFSKVSQKKVDLILSIFGINDGTRMDTDVLNIDNYDETKAFIYDNNNNPIINSGSYCDGKILTNSLKEYYKLNKLGNSNVKGLTFDIDNKNIEGSLNLTSKSIEVEFLSPNEINLSIVPNGLEVNFNY